MALLPVHKPKATGCEREVHLYNKQQSYLISRLTRGRCFLLMRFCSLFAPKYNVSCYKCIDLYRYSIDVLKQSTAATHNGAFPFLFLFSSI